MKSPLLLALAASALLPGIPAQGAARPRLLGLAQVAFYAHDVGASRKFYGGFLGYEEAFTLSQPDGALRAALFKIGDRQTIEIVPEKTPHSDRLAHISIETDDVEAMRLYLKSRGVRVPDRATPGVVGTAYFQVADPDGHTVEFIEYGPGSGMARDTGRHLPGTRLSPHMSHAGIVVHDLAAAAAFYGDLLGCTETWRGSGNGKALSWVTFQLPDSEDWIEFMLFPKTPDLAALGVAHHFCLVVPDVAKAKEVLEARPLPPGARFPSGIAIGRNRKRQIRAFDPDGTRVEIMEPDTIDGKPAPSSTAPPPAG
jgi:lactoylglutathione lyase